MFYNPLILTAGYDGVRALLGVTDQEVSDADVEQDPYLPYVENQVATAIPDYASLVGADLYALKTGVECWTAARLCHLLAGKAAAGTFGMTSGGFRLGDYEERGPGGVIEKMDYRRKAEELARLAAQALSSISTISHPAPSPLLLAGPTRSRSNVPSSTQEWLNKILPDVVEWPED